MKINSPSGLHTRPTTSIVREAVMNIVGGKINNCNWLDLCSGSGIMGCEALQRGAKTVIAVELNSNAARVCKSNLSLVSERKQTSSNFEVINSDVITWLKEGFESHIIKSKQTMKANLNKFDFVYFDPPYKAKIYSSVLENLINGKWLQKKSLVICEFSKSSFLEISESWTITNKRHYGKSSLIFLTPNLA